MRTRLIIGTTALWLLFFGTAKVVFALSCGDASACEIARALWHGLPIDLSTTGYFLTVPILMAMAWNGAWRVRRFLMPWHTLCAILASAAVVVDASLYPFWQFKLDASILNYIDTPGGALASVSPWFVIWRTAVFIALTTLTTWLLWRITPARLHALKHRWPRYLAWRLLGILLCGLTFLAIRGGVGESTMNVGVAYHSERNFMNHVAVNPLFSFIASISKTQDFASEFNLLPEDERTTLFAELYPSTTNTASTVPPTRLLKRPHPNVLVILWESAGGAFFAPFGGTPDVTTNLEQLAHEGILFSRMYCCSWRTDRGMVSALSGWFAYPTLTLMRIPAVCERIPCLGNAFARAGYDTFFLYGGDINFTHTAGYLMGGGYHTLISDKDFTLSERATEQWGVTDSITFNRLYDEILNRSRTARPWHGGMLTLSSHDPYKVPFKKHDDKVLNAMSYTDHCLGRFISRLRAQPDVWDNLLIVILPDHGLLRGDMTDTDDLYFHSPMVWTGGACQPCQVDKIMSQSDMPATLLSAAGLPHDDFTYSRDVMSPTYTYHFAYANTTESVLLIDSAGVTALNTQTLQPLPHLNSSPLRLNRLKAILQTSYKLLDINNFLHP